MQPDLQSPGAGLLLGGATPAQSGIPTATARTAIVPSGRVGLVGAGGFGRFILEAYRQAGDIAVVAVADPNLAGTAPATHPELQIQPDWRTLLDDPSIEVIHLAAPPFLRGEVAIPALRAGKSVFCEKPLALSLAEADRMIAVSRETGMALGVDYVLRHHPAFKLLDHLASTGLLGPVRTFSLQNFAQALPSDHWMWDERKSGGILVEHGVHFFDAFAQIAGSPLQVQGIVPRREANQVTVWYVGGALGTYFHEFAFLAAVERTHAIALFQQGYVEIDGWIPEAVHGGVVAPVEVFRGLVEPLQLPVKLREEAGVTRFEVPFPDRRQAYRSAIVDGMRELISCHREPGRPMTVSTQDARNSLALALAARRAAETGTAVRLMD